MDNLTVDVQAVVDLLITNATAWGLKVVVAIVILIIGRMAAGWVRKGVGKALTAANTDATLIPFLTSVGYYLVLGLTFIAVLQQVGIQTASLVAVLGAAGLAIGLAMQGTLSNVSSGVMLLVFRPFRVGDFIDAGGQAGSVQAIGLFSTTLNTPDNVRIVVPNSSVYGNVVKNFSANDTRRNDIVVGVSYDDDLGKALETIRTVLRSDSRVLAEPEAVVAVSELGDSSVNIVVRPWCKREDYWALRFELMKTLKEQIEGAGLSIPYPQRDVHLFQKT